ncbi:MAG: efflux RND transporter periplasmic adaptor subunit, partial [Myxococcaceae bacterium]
EAELAARASAAKRSSLRIAPEGDNLFWVVAPRSGSVVDLDVVASQEVQPSGDKPLVRISELSEVLVLADVQESDAYDLKVGGEVTIRTRAGAVTRTGTIERISEVVDPKRRTVELRIRASNEDRALRPNSFVDVELKSDQSQKRIRVPSEAVVTDGQNSVVFVARGEGRLERVTVTPGRQRAGEVELRAGLEPGSRYVSKGAILLLNQLELEH